MQVRALGLKDLLEKEMTLHSLVLLAGKFHGQRSLAGYSLQRVGHNLATEHTLSMEHGYIFFHKEALHVKLQWAGMHITKARTD